MKKEALKGMSKVELDTYGALIGIDVTGKKTIDEKVEEISRRRERVADIDVLGLTITVPMKRLRDKRVTDILSHRPMTDEEAEELLILLVGEEQNEKLIEAVTEEDGVVDVDALGFAISRILNSGELKNF